MGRAEIAELDWLKAEDFFAARKSAFSVRKLLRLISDVRPVVLISVVLQARLANRCDLGC